MQPCKSKGLDWPFLLFSGGLLWMQRGINAMAWSGRNTELIYRYSEEDIPHSIATFWLTTHELYLTGDFQLQRNIWELLAILFLAYLCNNRLKLSIHYVQSWRKIACRKCGHLAYKMITESKSCLLFLCNPCADTKLHLQEWVQKLCSATLIYTLDLKFPSYFIVKMKASFKHYVMRVKNVWCVTRHAKK